MATTSTTTKRPAEASSSHDRPTKRAFYDYDKTITLLVGPKEHRFVAHQDALCAKSKFFQAACSKQWREGHERVLRLPEVKSKTTFQVYMDWTYTNELVVDEVIPSTPIAMSTTEVEDEVAFKTFNRLIKLYLLGDFLDDGKLRNEVIRSLNRHAIASPCFLNSNQYHRIWENTPSNSLLRAWVVDVVVSVEDPDVLETAGMRYPVDLMSRVASQAIRRISNQDPDEEGLKKRLTTYLEHDVDN